MNLNLSKRISLFVGALILVLSLILGFIAINLSSRSLMKQSKEALEQLSIEGAHHLNAVIAGDVNTFQELANKARVQSMKWDDQVETLTPDIERLGFQDIAVATPDGISRSILGGSTFDVSFMDYFSKAMSGEALMSDVFVSQVNGELLIAYAAPIRSNGTVVGVLIGTKDGRALSKITDEMGFGENGYAYIMNPEGRLFAHPNIDNVVNQVNVLKDKGDFEDWGLALEKLGVGSEGSIDYKFKDSQRYMGITTLNNGWILGVGAYETDILAEAKTLKMIILVVSILAIGLGSIASVLLGNSISKPIVSLSNTIVRLSNYDLKINENNETAKYGVRKDEIGIIANAITAMQNNLLDVITEIGNSAELVASSSEELTATSEQSAMAADEVARAIEDIANGATSQARDTESGVVSVGELGNYINNTLDGIENLYINSSKINTMKDEGLDIIKDLVEKTEQNNIAMGEISKIIAETNDSAEKINIASQMIGSIAEQTNLLALNAAIEAARAGEFGKGFAVVAEEIRHLAVESNLFTAEITNIISELIDKTRTSINTTKQMEEISADQANSVSLTTERFEGITLAIGDMENLINNLRNSGKEMEIRENQMVELLENLSAISEENAAGTQEASASVEEQTAGIAEIANSSDDLAHLAQDMQAIVHKFNY